MSTPANQQGVRVEVRDLRKKFGDHEVLRGVSFTVERGEIFVLMGPSGSGKSVLLKHIIGLEEADGGEMLIEGHSIHAEGLRDRYRMAMVFQSGALLNSLTVGENVGLYLREHRLKPEAEIRRVVAEKLAIVGLTGAEE
ncbi:MAG: ATP-binding cassette domain-containing protein, partial [Verrucomicrobia bacterium]|nr:ATP-binding cassette domain-containing protein [Verrucomicrobiota bacterium]